VFLSTSPEVRLKKVWAIIWIGISISFRNETQFAAMGGGEREPLKLSGIGIRKSKTTQLKHK